MFTYRGRGGPSRSTPTNVQCQKCLKRGHYSYECKASSQERPYVSRPSRSQQFRNPKLVPKLTNDILNPLEKKQGVADEQLAKAEAERARKREREERDDELIESAAKRPRSVSSHSVSTISTGASRSPSPVRERTRSPPPARRSRSPYSDEDTGPRGGRRDDSRIAPLRTTAETATDLGNLSPLERTTDTRGGKGGIHRSPGDPTNLDLNTLASRGHLSTGDDDLKGQIDVILGQDERGILVGGIMDGDTAVGARLRMSSLGSAV
ncbi:Hypothetical protein NCS54_00696400 [Fusarium falciforme]|uniref:Hypothetical protein n=1 Tax=Fusarium falciforme TaxID=195108 RepID=UPI0023006880|nr:Hypothetical protein NCS54_00696400 [Fusarium falciforme]WAO89570.1 Hypothetical protein NCS54_00696400 [Fusarium falciforme]